MVRVCIVICRNKHHNYSPHNNINETYQNKLVVEDREPRHLMMILLHRPFIENLLIFYINIRMIRDFSICTDLVSVAEQTETSGARETHWVVILKV